MIIEKAFKCVCGCGSEVSLMAMDSKLKDGINIKLYPSSGYIGTDSISIDIRELFDFLNKIVVDSM